MRREEKRREKKSHLTSSVDKMQDKQLLQEALVYLVEKIETSISLSHVSLVTLAVAAVFVVTRLSLITPAIKSPVLHCLRGAWIKRERKKINKEQEACALSCVSSG